MSKILVIEDNNLIRETVLEILNLRGFEAIGAENGKLGVELAIAQIPDLILSDVMMPELNGFEVFEILRSHPATASIPFIFLTASEMEKALELKADGYLKKPCSITEILGAIATQLEKPTVIEAKTLLGGAQAQKTCPELRRSKEEGTWASLRLKKRKKEQGRRNTNSWKVELRMS
jgi:CheY-like chemotaxis protein